MASWALACVIIAAIKKAGTLEFPPLIFFLAGVIDAVIIIGTAYVIFALSC